MAVDFVRLDRPIAGVSPQAIATEDFNGDGNLDLATANTRSDSVSILLGDGTGDFQAIADITVGGSNPQSLVAGDFNSNGYPDIAVANLSGNVSILLSDGTGNFRYMSTLAVDDIACAKDDRFSFGHFFTPQSIATGDINSDGLLDLAIAGPEDLYKDVLLLTGDGTGEFRFADGLSINGDVQDVLLTDVNGDGRVDVATANDVSGNGTDTVAVWLGNGSDRFGTETEVSLGTNTPKSLLAEDLNGDGNTDLAIANAAAIPGSISILLGNGTGNFVRGTDAVADAHIGVGLQDVVAADIDGNGAIDLVGTNGNSDDIPRDTTTYVQASDDAISLFLGEGNGELATATDFATSNGCVSATVGDWNKDGKMDLATVGQNVDGISVLVNASDTEPNPPSNPSPATTSGNDVILGTEVGEQIFGMAGNDAIAGFGGDDALNGGPGDDTLNGNAGSDMVFGGNTSTDANVPDAMKQSVLIGGVTTPEDGNDILLGGLGDDTLGDHRGNDIANGNMGNDFIFGGAGSDSLYGGQNDDIIFGDADTPLADGAGDWLYGDLGNDTLIGGEGADVYVLRRDTLTYDTVVYQDGEDVFALPAETTFENLNFIVGSVEETPGTFITYIPNNEQILAFLPDVDPSAMSADDFLAV